MKAVHVLSVSGGKDSTAMYLLALERGLEFRAVFADTGNESPITLDYVRDLPRLTGGPEIEWVKAEFPASKFERKRLFILEHWPAKHGVTPERAAQVAELIQPSGNPFLDLCLLKSRFPSVKRRFCTEVLKMVAIEARIFAPLIDADNHVISWRGVRREESPARANTRLIYYNPRQGVTVFNPLAGWDVSRVIKQHERHGIPLNPLYKMGFTRVGCMPCINSRKAEVLNIAKRFPEEIERIAEWERLVSATSPREKGTFFAFDKTPGQATNGISDVVEWAKTTYGGRQYDLEAFLPAPVCQSEWGLCE